MSLIVAVLLSYRESAASSPLLEQKNRNRGLKTQPLPIPEPDRTPPTQKKDPPTTTPTPKPKDQQLIFAPPPQLRGTTFYQGTLDNKIKAIALTFDDGPSPYTLKILEILQRQNIKATFFCLGANLQTYPEIAKRVVKEGHAIGNHTWHHLYRNVDVATAAAEIDNTAVHIYRATGAKSFLFRPPGGRLNNGLAAYAKKKNYVVVMWSIDTKDFLMPPATSLAYDVLLQARSGAVVLMHDGGGNRAQTVQALPEIIKGLKQKGYRFVTIPELLIQQTKKQETAGTKS
ncbi:MAG TPA: polysaccharide deacetylase family protein [Kamptonema sp.]|nr:polysaccharide deacetylase family protein [Kamptonema sp.]